MRKLKMGMVGGGIDAFIGDVHRKAAAMDGLITLVGGAFSSNPEKSQKSGRELGLNPVRVYDDFHQMIEMEKNLPEGEKMDFISIVTPNHMHYPPAKMALENGFPVICDKPITFSTDEARDLVNIVEQSKIPFALTHNYTGYPMVKQAREMIRAGELGAIRKVVVQYHQGWLATKLEESDQKQAAWRTDPTKSGKAGAFGDIGTHAENLLEYICGLHIEKLYADISTFVPGRKLDDDGHVLLHLQGGAKGIMSISQVAVGEENDLSIKIYGEKASLKWKQMEPNTLIMGHLDGHLQYLRTGVSKLYQSATAHQRVPAGHPEGYLEAFANIYRNFAMHLNTLQTGEKLDDVYLDYPTVRDGLRGMRFIDAVVESSQNNTWISL